MAVVLDALAARVMKTITDMGEEKIRMLLGVSQEIKKLQTNVEPLRNLLTDAERRRITDKSVQAWVTKLKNAMYEADDILDLCQLEAMDRQEKQHSRGLSLRLREKLSFLGFLGDILQPFLFCVKNPGFANEVGSRIKKLNDELATIHMGVADFKFMNLGSYEVRRRPPTSSASYPRREDAQFVPSDLVGEQIKKNTEELEHKLIADSRHKQGSNAVRVVAIIGQGGIGKSTLAKTVFASEAIKQEFKIKIWLSVTQQFTKVDLLRAAISQARRKHGDEKDETILVQDLTDALSQNKFLLVMDDVWNQEAWENVLRTPILNAGATQPGSRVLVTSRKVDVVRSMGASIVSVDTLNEEDAWCLLKKRLPQPQEKDSNQPADPALHPPPSTCATCPMGPALLHLPRILISREDSTTTCFPRILISREDSTTTCFLRTHRLLPLDLRHGRAFPQVTAWMCRRHCEAYRCMARRCYYGHRECCKPAPLHHDRRPPQGHWLQWSARAWHGPADLLASPRLPPVAPHRRSAVASQPGRGPAALRRRPAHGEMEGVRLQQNSQVGVERDFDEWKDIGMKIVKKCDGLPLAIKVMGGLLSKRDPKEHDWEIVLHKDLGWEEEGGSQGELNYSVSLSYDDLSPELKQCFLYYSLLPKGSGFPKGRVISMWISEGFVQHDERSGSDQLDLEEIGDEYHRELEDRNLLEPDDSNNNHWEYTLHDVVRSFAQFMAKEEAFVVQKDHVDMTNLLPENKYFCRLSIKATHSELEWTILEKQKRLRTLLLINCEIKPGGSLAHFASLRVLDINSKESDWLVDSLCELRHLRYLSFSNTDISRLPGDIHKMRLLQHIQVKNCTELEKLPNSITKLACLRYLNLFGSNVDVIPRGFGGLTDLTSLYAFPVKMDGDWCSLEELEALSHLRHLAIQSLENVPGSSVAKRAKISNKKNLEFLVLSCYKDEEEEEDKVCQIGLEQQERIEAVFDELCPPPRLETLIIKRYFGRRLPNWLQSPAATTFKSLKSIVLEGITHCTRLPDGLCRMRGLEVLVVIYAPAIEYAGPEFQTHDAARGDGGVAFSSLRKLWFQGLSGWKEWDWEEDDEQSKVIAMPSLERLYLTDCKLTHLPPGLASDRRQNLRIIELCTLTLLEYVENFPSVVELKVYYCPEVKRISGLSKLRTVDIYDCPKLKLLEGVSVLESMELDEEQWEVSGADARCTPKTKTKTKGYQQDQVLPEELVITR